MTLYGDWFDAIDRRNARILALLRNPDVVALVKTRARPSIGRVPDIPILCANHESGYYIALTPRGEVVDASYTSVKGAPALTGIAHVDDVLEPFEASCVACGAKLRRSSAWMVEQAIRSLTKQRTAIRVRRT